MHIICILPGTVGIHATSAAVAKMAPDSCMLSLLADGGGLAGFPVATSMQLRNFVCVKALLLMTKPAYNMHLNSAERSSLVE